MEEYKWLKTCAISSFYLLTQSIIVYTIQRIRALYNIQKMVKGVLSKQTPKGE